MKRISTITGLALVLAVSMFIGCNTSKDDNNLTDEGRVAVKVGADINTRASGTQWFDNDQIGITMFNKGTFVLAEGSFTNCKYKTTAATPGVFGAADAASIIYFPKTGAQVDFMSYYPYSTLVTAGYVMPLDVSNQSDLTKIDFMTAQHLSGDSKDNPSVKLRFYHRLSKIIFNLSLPSGELASRLIGSTITVQGMYTRGNYSLNANTLGVETIAGSVADLPLTLNGAGNMAVGIVFPRPASAGIVFQIALTDGGRYTARMDPSLVLQAGYQYTFNITLQKTPIEVTADIVDWLPGGISIMDAH